MFLAASEEESAPRSSQVVRLPRRREPIQRIAARSGTHSIVLLDLREVWAFETHAHLAYVHSVLGRFDIDVSLSALELTLGAGFLRVHRNWLVAVTKVREMGRTPGEPHLFIGEGVADEGPGVAVPVALDRVRAVRQALLGNAIGLRRRA